MHLDDNTYSRVVAWLKIALPLLALAVLSTLFLVARTVDPAQQLPFAKVDVDEIAREQRVGAPNFSGVTSEGAAISLSARKASPNPDDTNKMSGDDIEAEIEFPNGERIEIKAASMALDATAGTAALIDSVQITSASGFSITTAHLEIALDRSRVYSGSRTSLNGAMGEISADSFELITNSGTSDSFVLVFKGAVKLLYKPSK